jgi:hypothetical protein
MAEDCWKCRHRKACLRQVIDLGPFYDPACDQFKDERHGRNSLYTRVREHIAAHGPVTSEQVATALGIKIGTARSALWELSTSGEITAAQNRGGEYKRWMVRGA